MSYLENKKDKTLFYKRDESYHQIPEYIEKQRIAHLGKNASEETKAKMRAVRNTPDHKALQSVAHKGFKPTEETKKN